MMVMQSVYSCSESRVATSWTSFKLRLNEEIFVF